MKKFGFMSRAEAAMSTLLLAAFMPMTAHAGGDADVAIEGVETIANTILNFMTGPIATAAGAIAIAIVGYRWFSGRMEMGKAVATVAGIVLVIGSVQIVNFIRSGSGIEDSSTIDMGSLETYEMPADAAAKLVLFSEQV
jgi:type IV secretion system protein VirB2